MIYFACSWLLFVITQPTKYTTKRKSRNMSSRNSRVSEMNCGAIYVIKKCEFTWEGRIYFHGYSVQ